MTLVAGTCEILEVAVTWFATLKVQDVGEGPAPIDILAGSDNVTSNTEGKISGVEVKFKLDENETSIKIGDEIAVSGHFNK